MNFNDELIVDEEEIYYDVEIINESESKSEGKSESKSESKSERKSEIIIKKIKNKEITLDINGKINSLISKFGKYNSKIKTKLDNINKAGVDNSIPCTTTRVSQNSRIYLHYEIVEKNNLSLRELITHEKGICIGISWSKYEEMKENIERNNLDEYLFNNIGSDGKVSCIVVIMRTEGYSGSNRERSEKIKLDEEIILNNWIPLRRKHNISGQVNSGNDKWEGHYYYNISGGQQDTLRSCNDQIFTTHKGFMTSNNVIYSNYVCLLYMMLHVRDINKIFEQDELNDYLSFFENYLNNIYYLNKSCIELIEELKCLNKNKILISPILCEEISIDDFSEKNKLNISHNIAVSKNQILFCEDNGILLSDYRPGNLFWDFKLGNMRQQDDTIEEYWESIKKSIKLRETLY